jgi:hypothetical protein
MKHLKFIETDYKGKTKRWVVCGYKDAELGKVEWSCGWRQYVFIPSKYEDNQWSCGCLEELRDFIINSSTNEKEAMK